MNIKWNAKDYKENFSFVPEYGTAVLDLIEHEAGAFVVDLGCGNGTLTQELYKRGFQVLGIDASAEMLELAKKNYPNLDFIQEEAESFCLSQQADVIFSNAVFHWINRQEELVSNLYRNLKSDGELVFEFGGYGCAKAVHSTLKEIFEEKGLIYKTSFYFPTIGEYANLLEQHGFLVKYAVLFDRPTKQTGEKGLRNWILMFNTEPFTGLSEVDKEEIIFLAEQRLRSRLCKNGVWTIDYVRIRMRALKRGM